MEQSTTMQTYVIEPLAPLVFRSAKQFGSYADGDNFPPPSSLAGLLRAVYAEQRGEEFSIALRQQAVCGPFLARRDHKANVPTLTLMLPRPADALYLRDNNDKSNRLHVVRCAPQALATGVGCDLPEGLLPVQPVQIQSTLKGKPSPGPEFWTVADYQAWCAGQPLEFEALEKAMPSHRLRSEQRTHVALNDETLSSEPGMLYQTAGLDLSAQRQGALGSVSGWQDSDYVFLGQIGQRLNADLACFGGERRLARLSPCAEVTHTALIPAKDDPSVHALATEVVQQGGLRLTLLTPGIFAKGHLPGWLSQTESTGHVVGTPPGCASLRLRLKAAAVSGWQPVSGWNLDRSNNKANWGARAMRKAVTAGAVYWFELATPLTETEMAHELAALWFGAISDHEQDRLDGFGTVLPAAWLPPTP